MNLRNYLIKFSKKPYNRMKMFLIKRSMSRIEFQKYKEAKKLIKNKKNQEALSLLQKTAEAYPGNYHLLILLANHTMKMRKWDLSARSWKTIFNMEKKFSPEVYLKYAKSLRNNKEITKAQEVIETALKKFPSHSMILNELAVILTEQRRWKKALPIWDELFSNSSKNSLPVTVYSKAALVYRKTKNYQKAEAILYEGYHIHSDIKLLSLYADLAIYQMNWTKALERIEIVLNEYDGKLPMNLLMKKSMILQVGGNQVEAEQVFSKVINNYQEEIAEDKKGFRKIIIFDNGKSRIEFYKKLKKTDRAIITFDSINMEWKNPPFSFKLLSRENLDIIAVRKRKVKTYQQDLSREDFYRSVHLLLKPYKEKFAYGFSLGAYTSLYFASSVDCTILALAPRLSIHPKYGKPGEKSKAKFKHSISMPYNDKIAPIIVFDPIQTIDNKFVNEEIVKAFPKAVLVKIPYAGHGMAPHLLKMGQLKEFILTVLDNKIPKYDRSKKTKSFIYFRMLGQTCLKRNKLNWANDLADRALELAPTDELVLKLKINALKKLEEFQTAICFTKGKIQDNPNLLELRLQLIDLYISVQEFEKGQSECQAAMSKFGDAEKLARKNKELEKMIKDYNSPQNASSLSKGGY